VTGKEIRLD